MLLYVRRVTFAFWAEMFLRSVAITLLFVSLWDLVHFDPDFHGGVVEPFYGMVPTPPFSQLVAFSLNRVQISNHHFNQIVAMLIMNTVLYMRAATLQILRYRLGELPEDPWWGRNVESALAFYCDFFMVIISSLGPLVWAVHLSTFRPITPEQAAKCRPYPNMCAILDYSDMPRLQKITHYFWGVT